MEVAKTQEKSHRSICYHFGMSVWKLLTLLNTLETYINDDVNSTVLILYV